MDIGRVTDVYLKLREKRSENKRKYDEADRELKEKQAKLEAVLLKFLSDNNMSSTKTSGGTVYLQEEIKPSAMDWDAVYTFIAENNAWDLLQKRLKKEFITSFMEDNDGDLPPGVKLHREHVVRVRKT